MEIQPKTFSWKKVEPKGNGPDWRGLVYCCMVGDCVIVFRPGLTLHILHLNPSLKTLCKLAVIEQGLERSELPHDIRWELSLLTPKKINRRVR